MTKFTLESQTNQQELRDIINKLGITQKDAVKLLSEVTGRSLSLAAIKTWLAKAGAKSAKPCPEWPAKKLKEIYEKRFDKG